VNSLSIFSLVIDTGLTTLFVAVIMALGTTMLAFVTTRFTVFGWIVSVLGQGLATVPSILIAMGILVPFQMFSMSWSNTEARLGGLIVFVAVVVLTSIVPSMLSLRRKLQELEQDQGMVGRSRGWSRTKLLLVLLGHPSCRRLVRIGTGSSLINLANLELLMGFLGEVGLGGGLTGAHRSWGQVLIRLRDAERYGFAPTEAAIALVTCLGIALVLYTSGAILAQGEHRADHF
jgi:hypothetical protein